MISISLPPLKICGEICLLATTLKNAKIYIYVLCFCDGSASLVGLILYPAQKCF